MASLPTNADVAAQFELLADIFELEDVQSFRVLAYRRAATRIRETGTSVAQMALDGKAKELQGVGKTIEEKIVQIVEDGEVHALTKHKQLVPAEVVEFLRIPGLGPKTVRRIWHELGITTLEGLREAAEAEQLRTLSGLGPRSEENVLRALAEAKQETGPGESAARHRRCPRCWRRSRSFVRTRRRSRCPRRAARGGGARPSATSTSSRPPAIPRRSSRTSPSCRGWWRWRRAVGRRRPSSRGTGSASTSASFRPSATATSSSTSRARRTTTSPCARRRSGAGSRSPSTASSITETGETITHRDEKQLYEFLGYQLIPPELRENAGELEAAREGSLPKLVELKQLKGDLHTHTTWSADGHNTVEEMALEAIARGYEYLAITDHSHYLREGRMEAQDAEIDAVNKKLAPFRLLKGVEANIRADGSLDVPDDVLAERDWVVASLHSAFHRDPTERVCGAMENPHVDCIGHLTARKIGRRESVAIDPGRVIETAARTRTALEINSQPDRLDMPDPLARLAGEEGVLVPVTSDAHRVETLAYVEIGIGQARRAWLTKKHVLNTRSWAQIEKTLKR